MQLLIRVSQQFFDKRRFNLRKSTFAMMDENVNRQHAFYTSNQRNQKPERRQILNTC